MANAVLFVALGMLVFVIAGGFFYGMFVLLNPSRTASDRLRELQGGKAAEEEVFDIINVDRPQEGMGGMASKLGSLAAPTSEEEKSKQRQMLLVAGYKNRHALEIFNGTRVTLALCLPLLAAPFASSLGLTQTAVAVLVAAASGYYIPAFWLSNVTEKRKRTLLKSFPDALDLLVSCVEAGLGLDAAFRRVAEEMENAAPDLSRELQLVTVEVNAGIPRTEALRHLSDRTGLDDINALVNVLVQAERFGTSVARALRVHSEHVRVRRMQRAEEKAAQVSPKLTVAMILFILPCLIIILIGPAIINVKNILLPTLAGQ